jgi:hypothetical protein
MGMVHGLAGVHPVHATANDESEVGPWVARLCTRRTG